MKLSIRFAVPLFTLVSLVFLYWKRRKRISAGARTSRWFYRTSQFFAKPIIIAHLFLAKLIYNAYFIPLNGVPILINEKKNKERNIQKVIAAIAVRLH